MPGYVAPLGKFMAFTNGAPTFAPLAGGKVYTYQAGTSTPTPTWTSAALNIQNSNPVILDSAGRASIFIPDASVMTYKFIIKDANDVLVYSEDGIVGAPAPAAGGGGGGGTPGIPIEVPVGTIMMYGGSTAPVGYLMCNGGSYPTATYPDLASALAGKYGSTGSTFNVPDFQQRFPLGVAVSGPAADRGVKLGSFDHRHTGPSHVHVINDHTHPMPHTHEVPYDGWSWTAKAAEAGKLQAGGPTGAGETFISVSTANRVTVNQNNPNTGSPASPLTMNADGTGNTGPENPPYLTVYFIIRHGLAIPPP